MPLLATCVTAQGIVDPAAAGSPWGSLRAIIEASPRRSHGCGRSSRTRGSLRSRSYRIDRLWVSSVVIGGIRHSICYRQGMMKPARSEPSSTQGSPKRRATEAECDPAAVQEPDTGGLTGPDSAATKAHTTLQKSVPAKKGRRSAPKLEHIVAPPVRTRREQRRAVDTKQAILDAALSEFAQVGFEAASIRTIAANTGLQHPLITYHYSTKAILWKAVAQNAFTRIQQLWDEGIFDQENMTPMERLRAEYFAFLRFTVAFPDFHHFMLRESRPGNPRLPWLVQTILLPMMERLLPQIHSAQASGDLPEGNPALIHYMMIGMTSVLSSLKDEIQQSTGLVTDHPNVVDEYLGIIDALIFRRSSRSSDPQAASSSRTITKRVP